MREEATELTSRVTSNESVAIDSPRTALPDERAAAGQHAATLCGSRVDRLGSHTTRTETSTPGRYPTRKGGEVKTLRAWVAVNR